MDRKLLNDAAQHLAGRPVVVRMQEPVWNNASGACYKSLDGRAIVDVNPGANDVLFTFLHECAHLRTIWSEMTPSDVWTDEPGSHRVKSEPMRTALRTASLPRESQADQIAQRWLDYAKKYSYRYNSGQNLLDARLRALLTWPTLDGDQ